MSHSSSTPFPDSRTFIKTPSWTRRDWLTCNAAALVATRLLPPFGPNARSSAVSSVAAPVRSASALDWDLLAQRAVEAAQRAGAQYADVHLTHTRRQQYEFAALGSYKETYGIGIRTLVNGYWGFAAVPGGDVAAVERLARAAVAQAKVNAQGLPRTADFGPVPVATGEWTMPVRIDPFTVSIEEKLATLQYWIDYARQVGMSINTVNSRLYFIRQERLVATSDKAHFRQTVYESGGKIEVLSQSGGGPINLRGITPAGAGWELFLDADIPQQLRGAEERMIAEVRAKGNPKPAQIGRYTLVCDGATMASVLDRTLGIATQLDRALGYEANASGTSYLNDPLGMLGTFKVASPLVTITANRSAPKQLATVKWDAEGVEPQPFTLVKDGVLVDFQTTREQAAWLAPYYQRQGRSVQSNGCAGVEEALSIPMQHMPNLAMTPAAGTADVVELAAGVKDGILIRNGNAYADFQARTGELMGEMYEIRDGKIRGQLQGGAVQFDSLDLWRHVVAVGGAATQGVIAATRFSGYPFFFSSAFLKQSSRYPVKGEPPQFASYSVQGVAATITNQPVIDLSRKA